VPASAASLGTHPAATRRDAVDGLYSDQAAGVLWCLKLATSYDKPLQPTDRAARDLESHWLNELPSQLTQLAYHIVKEMGTRLTAGKAVVKGLLELPQFLQDPLHIAGDKVKHGNGKFFAGSPTLWEHVLPPGDRKSLQEHGIDGLGSCQR
jgi:hypothetical protein